MERHKTFRVAAIQASPVLPVNKKATIEKACSLIREAGRNGAQLIVFPETFVPMYPNWSIDLQEPTEWANNLFLLTKESIEIPGEETERLGRAAKQAGAYVCIGVNEKVAKYDGMLFNALFLIAPDGKLIGKHRKLLPSNREKIFWHRGDGADVHAVFETKLARVGGLICYEHLQPLLKYAMYAQGEQVHCACWPGWPDFSPPGRSNRHVIDVVSRSYAIEGQCFVVTSSLYVPEKLGEKAGFGNAAWVFFGGSGIINPSGEYMAGPAYDEETILYADIDLSLITLRKTAIDTTGRDTRWDLFDLRVRSGTYVPYREVDPRGRSQESEVIRVQELLGSVKKVASELRELEGRIEAIAKGRKAVESKQ